MIGFYSQAQIEKSQNMKVEQTREAQYAGGDEALYTYIFYNLKYSEQAKLNKAEGEIMLSFFVEKDSTLSNIKIIKEVGFSCGDSLRNVFKKIKYIPASENGTLMRSNQMINVPVKAH